MAAGAYHSKECTNHEINELLLRARFSTAIVQRTFKCGRSQKLPNKEVFQCADRQKYLVFLSQCYSKLFAPWNDKLLMTVKYMDRKCTLSG